MKTLMIFSAAILWSLSLISQPAKAPGSKKQKMEAHKIAFLSHHLELTPEEAQKFWPVYNQYNNEIKELKQNFMNKSGEQKVKQEELTEKQIEDMIMKEMEFSQKKLDLKKQYHSKFKEVLPVRKLAKLYKVEKNFMKKMRGKRNVQREKQGPPVEGNF